MADRAIEPLPRQHERSAPSKLLPADLAAELQPAAERLAKGETARRAAAVAFSFLALLDPLPSDYYLG